MRHTACVVIVLGSMCALGLSRVQNRPFSLSIGPREVTAVSGRDIMLDVVIINTAAHEISFEETNPDCDFTVEVRHANGALADLRLEKNQLSRDCMNTTRDILVRLKPLESFRDHIVITRMADIRRPDKYTVQVTRKIASLSSQVVKSNMITVTVTK